MGAMPQLEALRLPEREAPADGRGAVASQRRRHADADDSYWVGQYRSVVGVVELDGGMVDVRAGDIVFGCRRVGLSLTHDTAGDWKIWQIPRSIVQLQLSDESWRSRVLRADAPLGALVRAYLAHLAPTIDALGPAATAPLMANVVVMLTLHGATETTSASDEPSADSELRLAAIKRSIARRFADASLTPRGLAAEQGISVRTLHLLFARSGTSVGRHLLETRLAAAHGRLADAGGRGRTVTDIAFSCGFEALSTFYRAFRDRYGYSPTDLRRCLDVAQS